MLAAGALLGGAGALEAQAEPPPLPEISDLVRVEDHPEDGILTLVFGPVNLPADGGHLRSPVQLVGLPIEGWLHGFNWEMRDGAGERLSPDLLHHVNFIDPDNRELFSPIPRRIMAAGRETREQMMPKLLGYPLAPNSRILITVMFANPTDEDQPAAYLHVNLSYSGPDDRMFDPRDVYPFYMDVTGPVGLRDFAIPPGTTQKSWEGSPAIDGRLLAIGGHVHDYADWIRLEDVTEDDIVWETEPEYAEGQPGRVVSVPTGEFWWRGGVKIFKDHVYRITVQYTNPHDEPTPDGGMGALGGIVWADEAAWPPFNRNDVVYAEDLKNTLEAPEKLGHTHGMDSMEHGQMEHGDDGASRRDQGEEAGSGS